MHTSFHRAWHVTYQMCPVPRSPSEKQAGLGAGRGCAWSPAWRPSFAPQNCISPAAVWNSMSRPLSCMMPSFSAHFHLLLVRVTFSNCATTTLS